jgi:polyhydroxybutyrate depolymerase
MRRYLMVVLLMFLPAMSTADPPAEPVSRTLMVAGLERTFHLLVPPSATPASPLVIALHGARGRGDRLDGTMHQGLSREAARRGWVLAMPDGIERRWNDGRTISIAGGGPPVEVDDVGFVGAMVDRLAAEGTIDPRQVFVVGVSNGGHMAYRLATEHPERFHTIAPIVSNLPEILADRRPSAPVSVMVMNGTADPLIPYEGGEVVVFGQSRGRVLSTEATIRWWAEHNRCAGEPLSTALEDRDPDDGTRIFVQSLRGCGGDVEVTLVKVQGGGHTWPGGAQYLPERVIGPVSADADSMRLVFGFFDRQGARLQGVPSGVTPP